MPEKPKAPLIANSLRRDLNWALALRNDGYNSAADQLIFMAKYSPNVGSKKRAQRILKHLGIKYD